jgi:hypothetical protein
MADCGDQSVMLIHSGDKPLDEHIAIRPTSETVMYPCKSPIHRYAPRRTRQLCVAHYIACLQHS